MQVKSEEFETENERGRATFNLKNVTTRLFDSSACCLFFVDFDYQVNGQGSRMTLDVYYESLCPDSRNFLVNQLAPNWKSLSSFVDLRLVPFGKATVNIQ